MLKIAAMMRIIFTMSVVLTVGVNAVFAQTGQTVSGTVTDTNGAVVQGASVRLLNLGSSQQVTATTDSSGRYEFTNINSGSYRLSVEQQGFAAGAESITIVGENIAQDFTLSPGAIQDVVTVTVGKGDARVASEVPQTVTVTTAEQLEQQRPRSTFEAIERAPNVIVRETNPARERPRLRGLDSSRVLIVIDGEKLNNARTDLQTGLSPSIIDVTQLEQTEVVGGAGSSLYGSDSLAGTINLITKGPERPSSDGWLFGLRFDGNYSSNGEVARGNGVANISNKFVAFRAGYSQFSLTDYSIGNRAITIEEVIAAGRFFTSVPTSIPVGTAAPQTNGPGSFAIFSVPAGGEIVNNGGRGFNAQADLWVFPLEKLNMRARYINSQHRNLGDAFAGPPYETQQRFNPFRNYYKFGFRVESLDLFNWLPRVAVNFYRQKLSFPQAQYDYTNQSRVLAPIAGVTYSSLFPTGSFAGTAFTGTPSVFTANSFTSTKNTITTLNVDVQATFAPLAGLLVTVGAQNLKDSSKDEFVNYGLFNFDLNRPNFGAATSFTIPTGQFTPTGASVNQTFTVGGFNRGASTPNTRYRDRAAFFQAEFDRFKYLRITGGLRVDNWQTEAEPSSNFPLGNEFGVLTAALPQLTANPGPLASQVEALPSLIALANRSGGVSTSNTTTTGSIGFVGRLPFGINPYFRYGTSYREPSISERYILRIFPAFPGLVAPVIGNPNLQPETGRTVDFGVKAQGRNYNASLGYFRNNLKNLIVFQTPEFGNICVAANPAIGLIPLGNIAPAGQPPRTAVPPCTPGQSAISFNGRINQAENVIDGVEGTGQYSQSLGSYGSLNPFVSFGTLHGTNKSPVALNVYRLENLQARTDLPFELDGSVDDFPLGNITPFRIIGGLLYNDRSGSFFAEYAFRHQARVKRIDPNALTGTTLVNYGTYAGFNAFTKHDIRAGYNWRRERYRISLTAGIQNFTDKLFWEHFQTAPAPGRSFVFGITTELFNLLGSK